MNRVNPDQRPGDYRNSPLLTQDRSATPKTYRRLPNGELVEITPTHTPNANSTIQSARQSDHYNHMRSSRSPNYVQGVTNYPQQPRSRSTTPGGTRYEVSKPHRPSYQKQSITPERYYQGESNIFQPGEARRIEKPPGKTTYVIESKPITKRTIQPDVQNINVGVVESTDYPRNNSIYAPQSFGNSNTRKYSPIPRRDRYIERHKIDKVEDPDILLHETSRPIQRPNKRREILSSRNRTAEKQTQTPDKNAFLRPETTKSIEISPSKKSMTEKKRKMPSYLKTGRYSERKSPPFGTRSNLRPTPENTSYFNLSTKASRLGDSHIQDTMHTKGSHLDSSNIQDTKYLVQEKKGVHDRYEQFNNSSVENPNKAQQ